MTATTVRATGLLTQHDLDSVIPSRTRQRWQQQGRLPKPARIFGDRRALILYPDVVLARVVLGVEGPKAQEAAVRRAWKISTEVFKSTAFLQVKLYLRRALRELPDAETTVLFSFVRDNAPGAWLNWQSCQNEARTRIEKEGIWVECKAGRIRDVRRDLVTIEADGAVHSLALESVACRAREGSPAALERIRVFDKQREFVVPALLIRPEVWKATRLDELSSSIKARISGRGRPYEDFILLDEMADDGVNEFHAAAMEALDSAQTAEDWDRWLDDHTLGFASDHPRPLSPWSRMKAWEPDVVALNGPIKGLDWEHLAIPR
jgi:hypothetical protein